MITSVHLGHYTVDVCVCVWGLCQDTALLSAVCYDLRSVKFNIIRTCVWGLAVFF